MSDTASATRRTRPTTDAEVVLYEDNPTIASRFPILLPDGSWLRTFTARCPECDEEIPHDMLRGTTTDAFGVLAMDAVGLCGLCEMSVRYQVRFRKDGTCDAVGPDGKWVQYNLRERSIGRRFLSAVRRLFR